MPHQIIYLHLLFLLILPNDEPPPFAAAALPPPANSDSSALLSFQSAADPAGNRLHFSSSGQNSSLPQCSFPGVTCSPDHRVIRLVLQNLGLDGTLPRSGVGALGELRILSLKSNALRGPPPDLSALSNLKALFLARNLLTGPFPPSLLSLRRLRTLDLSHNLFSGPIPPGLASLARLDALLLQSNRFSGRLPPLNMSSLKAFDVSANDLSGPVPVTAAFASFGAAAFEGNARLCGAVVLRECGSNSNFFDAGAAPAAAPSPGVGVTFVAGAAAPDRRRHVRALMAVGVFVLAVVLVVLLVGVCLVVRGKKKRRRSGGIEKNVVFDEVEGNGERSAEEVEDRCNEVATAVTEEKMKRLGRSGSLVFCAGENGVYSLEQLMWASAEMLGRGSLGSTYKAVLDSRLILCVKRLDAGKIGLGGKEGFERHMEVVGRLRHPNLVPLRAFFQGKEERLLVYDYQTNGSLHSLIHGMIS